MVTKYKQTVASIICVICLSTLSSCSFIQDNSAYDYKTDDVKLSLVEDIAEDAESVANKDYVNISFPKEINIVQPESVYILETKLDIPDNNHLENVGRTIFKKFFGDKYDESFFCINNELSAAEYENGEQNGNYSGDMNMSKKSIHFDMYEIYPGADYYSLPNDSNNELPEVFDYKSTGEMCNMLSDNFSELLAEYINDYRLSFSSLVTYDNNGSKMLFVSGGYSYNGIMLEEKQSPYFKDEDNSLSFYSTANIRAVLDDNGVVLDLYAEVPRKIISAKEQKEMIKLSDAAILLSNNLSQNSHYEIKSVELRYCCRVENDADIESQTLIYEPTWIFVTECDQTGFNRKDIKVNAISGEIFMEVV